MAETISVKYTLIDEVSKPMDKIKSSSKSVSEGFDFVKTSIIGAVGAVSIGRVISFGKEAVKAFEESEVAARRLAVAMHNTGESFAANEKELKRVTSALLYKTGVADEAQYEALGKLTTITGSFTNSLALLPEVMDLAAFAGTDLSEASIMFGNILEGNIEKLPQYLKFLKDMKDAGASNTEIINALRKATKGYAEESASETQKIGAAWGEMLEVVGGKLASSGIMKFLESKITNVSKFIGGIANTSEEGLILAQERKAELAEILIEKQNRYNNAVNSAFGSGKQKAKKELDETQDQIIRNQNSITYLEDKIKEEKAAAEKERQKLLDNSGNGLSAAEENKKLLDKTNALSAEDAAKIASMNRTFQTEQEISKTQEEKKLKEIDDYNKQLELKNNKKNERLKRADAKLHRDEIEEAENSKNRILQIEQNKYIAMSTGINGLVALSAFAAKKNKDFAVAAKALAIAEATMNTYRAATAALAMVPFTPFNYIAAGGAIASGLANVGMITQQTFQTSPGYDKTIPGNPNQVVMAMVHGGEKIGRDSGGGGITVNLQIPNSAKVDVMAGRELAKTIDRLARDGYFDKAFNLKRAVTA